MIKNSILLSIIISSLFGCNGKSTQKNEAMAYREKHRPQFHFSPPEKWMNDPNGLVFYEGEYHLFYQYYPDGIVWGPMHWGHSISKDLFHWEHLPIALYPDSLGYIFSGSAVIDWNNTSGFGVGNSPPMVAIFTYHNMEKEKAGNNDYQTQGLAYSIDKGRTWTKYNNNPVLANPGIKDFRDPKVSWNKVAKKWIMALAVKNHISFYSSTNLKEWRFESDFGGNVGSHGGVWECPDLFELEDENGNKKYVLLVSINPGGRNGGSATQYFIGEFDGKVFTNDTEEILWLDYGTDNYAGVTWSDIPKDDGRRLLIGWMSNWNYGQVVPTEKWRSAMTIPRQLKLIRNGDNIVVQSKPIDEIKSLETEEHVVEENTFSSKVATYSVLFSEIGNDSIEVILSNKELEKITISYDEGILTIDRNKSGNFDFSDKFAGKYSSDKLSNRIKKLQIFVDVSSVEVFVNDGEIVMTELVFPTNPFTIISYSGMVGQFKVTYLNSIWKSDNANTN